MPPFQHQCYSGDAIGKGPVDIVHARDHVLGPDVSRPVQPAHQEQADVIRRAISQVREIRSRWMRHG